MNVYICTDISSSTNSVCKSLWFRHPFLLYSFLWSIFIWTKLAQRAKPEIQNIALVKLVADSYKSLPMCEVPLHMNNKLLSVKYNLDARTYLHTYICRCWDIHVYENSKFISTKSQYCSVYSYFYIILTRANSFCTRNDFWCFYKTI